ncbi:MAG TPA: lactate racemase domain-containing protein [Acidimicrobiales bacterium]|nr:lactate racemase domain-containing protein [Acidimicrobiales bacterium]
MAIRWQAWFGDTDLALPFPAGWQVRRCPPRDGADIGDRGIAAAFANPVGTPRLRELAAGRRAPVVVVDDLSRPTPADRLLPPVLDELAAAGITDEQVTVLVGAANHRVIMRQDLLKKLGADVLARCPVRSHFSWAGCQPVGTTSRGTPIELNRDFLAADLRILVGSVVPHPVTGFSGGAKLVVPAVASIGTATAFHTGVPRPGEGVGMAETTARRDAEEGARMAGVDFIVNAVPNTERGMAGLVTGDLVAAHRAGVALAREAFATSAPAGADVCVLSAYPKDNELQQYSAGFTPLLSAPEPLVRPGGTVVMATAASEGAGFHSLFGRGMHFGGPAPRPPGDCDLVLFAPGAARGDLEPEDRDTLPIFATWDHTVAWLAAKHGDHASVSVFPSAVTQLVTETVPLD